MKHIEKELYESSSLVKRKKIEGLRLPSRTMRSQVEGCLVLQMLVGVDSGMEPGDAPGIVGFGGFRTFGVPFWALGFPDEEENIWGSILGLGRMPFWGGCFRGPCLAGTIRIVPIETHLKNPIIS